MYEDMIGLALNEAFEIGRQVGLSQGYEEVGALVVESINRIVDAVAPRLEEARASHVDSTYAGRAKVLDIACKLQEDILFTATSEEDDK